MTFAPIDIGFFIIILVFAISALIKGFLNELFSKISVIAGLAFAIIFTPKLDVFVHNSIKNETLSKVVSFFLIFIVVFLVVCIIQQIVKKIFSGEIMAGLDKTLGFLLGVIEGLIVTVFVIAVLKVQPWFNISSIFEGSFFYKMLGAFVKIPENYISSVVS